MYGGNYPKLNIQLANILLTANHIASRIGKLALSEGLVITQKTHLSYPYTATNCRTTCHLLLVLLAHVLSNLVLPEYVHAYSNTARRHIIIGI
jgi:hypothetical protein